jgi:hypothetical protein
MNPRGPVLLVKDLLSGFSGKVGAIAIAAQMELHDVLQPPWFGFRYHFAHQACRLRVGQMAMFAQHPRDQVRRPAAGSFHVHIVIEFDRKDIDIR